MLGPEANHYITVSHPQNFHWREGSFGDLIPLLGDGLLTIDGAYHDRARRIMMPAFHRERIEASISTMAAETERAVEALRPARSSTSMTGCAIWRCGSRCGRCSGSIPTTAARARRRRITSSARSASTASTTPSACCAAPVRRGRSCSRSRAVLDEIVFGEIAAPARGAPTPSERHPQPADRGARRGRATLSDRQIRDQMMTLMFAGHDTSTSTLPSFLRARPQPGRALERLRAEQDEVLGDGPPTAAQLDGGMPLARHGARRDAPPLSAGLDRAPARGARNSSSAATPCRPARTSTTARGPATACPRSLRTRRRSCPNASSRERKVALPRGAYIPFGGGSRICIGKRFGQTEVKLVATMALAALRFERCRAAR